MSKEKISDVREVTAGELEATLHVNKNIRILQVSFYVCNSLVNFMPHPPPLGIPTPQVGI